MPVRRMIYLDKKALEQYVTPMEGGALSDTETMTDYVGSGSAGFKLGVAEGKLGGEGGRRYTHMVADTPATMFSRLLDAAKKDTGWKEITHPAREFPNLQIADLISWNCDVHIPDASHAVAKSGDGLRSISVVQNLLDAAAEISPDNQEMAEQSGAVKNILRNLTTAVETIDARRSIIGESDCTDWKVTGSLTDEHIQVADVHDIEGQLTIVGQVVKLVPTNRWHSLVSSGLVNRERRRKLEREGPDEKQMKFFLQGPAVALDVLAIYR